jgi:hypothetical protein
MMDARRLETGEVEEVKEEVKEVEVEVEVVDDEKEDEDREEDEVELELEVVEEERMADDNEDAVEEGIVETPAVAFAERVWRATMGSFSSSGLRKRLAVPVAPRVLFTAAGVSTCATAKYLRTNRIPSPSPSPPPFPPASSNTTSPNESPPFCGF